MPMQSIKSHCVDIDVSKSRANILVCIELHVTVHKCALNQISLHTDIDVNKHSHCAFNRTPLYTYLQPIESPRIHHRKYFVCGFEWMSLCYTCKIDCIFRYVILLVNAIHTRIILCMQSIVHVNYRSTGHPDKRLRPSISESKFEKGYVSLSDTTSCR